jgi:hypothetical protein
MDPSARFLVLEVCLFLLKLSQGGPAFSKSTRIQQILPSFVDLLRQVILDTYLFNFVELGFDPVDMFLFIFQYRL